MSNSTATLTSFTSSDIVIETTTALPSSTTPADPTSDESVFTSTTFASSVPPSTELVTSTQIITPTAADGNTQAPQETTIVLTSTRPGTTVIGTTQRTRGQTADATSSSDPSALPNSGGSGGSSSGGGLSTGGKTAIAVVIPVVVVAVLVGLGIWFWRKRKSKKDAAEQRQKEMEDYSYNPNGDPTLPAIGSDAGTGTQMTEDHSSGYRGWGAAAGMSNRKQSTTLSAGNTHDIGGSGAGSDYGAQYGGYQSSPQGNMSDGHSGDPMLHNQRSTMGSDDLAELGSGPAAGVAAAGGIRRGPSNASSAYSAGARSDEEPPPMPPPGQAYDYNPNAGYGYGQHGPYGDGSYGGNTQPDMPVVRDVSARRNTRIQPGGAYQQGNSGIAQNF